MASGWLDIARMLLAVAAGGVLVLLAVAAYLRLRRAPSPDPTASVAPAHPASRPGVGGAATTSAAGPGVLAAGTDEAVVQPAWSPAADWRELLDRLEPPEPV